MEVLPKHPLLNFKENTLNFVRKQYNLDKTGAVQHAIDILDEWIKMQNHFTKKDFDKEYLERIIITSKGSIERAKKRLDQLCTFRTLVPKFFICRDIRTNFSDLDGIIYFSISQMTEDYSRVALVQIKGDKFTTTICLDAFRFFFLLAEHLVRNDYTNCYHLIVDFREANLTELLSKLDVVEFREAVTALFEGYGVRVKGVHILTESKLVDTILAIGKSIVKEKIRNRFYSHRTVEGLFKHLPKNVLPKDYGGTDKKTLSEITADWKKLLFSEEYEEYYKMICSARSNESLRQKDTFNDQYMGMPGTFRTLSVD